jgi:HTH-type transcriptional regulator / antitoxin HigA
MSDNITTRSRWQPDWSTHPGQHLEEYLDFRGWSQAEFHRVSGLSTKLISEIINKKNPVTPETAIVLERVLGLKAYIWLRLQESWDLFQAKEVARAKAAESKEWLNRFDQKALQASGVLPKTKDIGVLVECLLAFLGIGAPTLLGARMNGLAVAHRQSSPTKSSPENVLAWHMLGERKARELDIPPYDKAKFEQAVRQIRALTVLSPAEFEPKMKRLCHSAGVALVFEKPLKSTGLFGAARWIAPDRALIQMSLRMKTNDHFWWTFFHECGHIILHEGRNFADDKPDGGDEVEAQANAFAESLLYGDQLQSLLSNPPRTKAAIEAESQKLGLHPGIVVGCLQHHKRVDVKFFYDLKAKFDWVEPEKAT